VANPHKFRQAGFELSDFGPHDITAMLQYRLEAPHYFGLDTAVLGLEVNEIHQLASILGEIIGTLLHRAC
jgi:hypothetical protein